MRGMLKRRFHPLLFVSIDSWCRLSEEEDEESMDTGFGHVYGADKRRERAIGMPLRRAGEHTGQDAQSRDGWSHVDAGCDGVRVVGRGGWAAGGQKVWRRVPRWERRLRQ